MKRDWDVIRDVLFEIEALPHEARMQFGYALGQEESSERRARAEHAFLLWEADYITAVDAGTMDKGLLLAPDLTWAGHDLLDTLRSKPVWERIKATAKEKGLELSFDAVKALGKVALDYVIKGG